MPSPIPDTRLAARFTQTSHSHHSPSIEPSTNKLPTPLNVCIIGSSQGIGAGIVDAYAKALAPSSSLILAARQSSASSLAAVEHHTKAINPKIKVLSLFVDITKNESVKELAKTIKKKVGKLDIVVLNSGYSGPVVLKVTEGDPQDFQDVFDVNVQGTYLIAHHLIPILIESGGAKQFLVVNTLGSLITSGPIANTAYCVSKMAQMRIIEFVGEQYGKEEDGGVNSVLVHPGAVLTEMADNTTPDSFRSSLTDDVGLCGAFCVWLSRVRPKWLNGRLVSAKWDVDELMAKKDVVEDQDLLKFGFRVGDAGSS